MKAYDWRIGVDNAFGYIVHPDGRRQLVESRLFIFGDGIAVDLHTGGAVFTPADGSCAWQPLTPEQACAIVGIPAPQVDGGSEVERRTDPFHVERNRSGLFCALVELIAERKLPCGHAMLAWREQRWTPGEFNDGSFEAPEVFACGVLERIALGVPREQAIRGELAGDAQLKHGRAIDQLLADTGWQQAIPELELRERRHQQRLDQATSRPERADDDDQQLLLAA